MYTIEAQPGWWRAEPDTTPAARIAVEPARPAGADSLAFAGLVAFTIILLVSPQAWFPVIKSLRIAMLAAVVAVLAHLAHRIAEPRAAQTFRLEMGLALALVLWAAATIPLSIWPGGSLDQLLEHLVKAVVFFWLIGVLVTSTPRLLHFARVLALCAVPLAATALHNYWSGEFVTTASSAVQRIAGYTGGSGLAGNPNDLALMLNLLIPITGAVFACTPGALGRVAAAATLLLSIAAVIATFSRAGFVTLAVIVLLGLLAMVRHRAAGVALVILLAGAAIPFALPHGYFDRLATITNFEADPTGSAQGRWSDFGVAVEYIESHPVVGAGLGQDLLALNQARGHATWRSVHNAFLQVAVDLGLTGLMLLAALLMASILTAGRVRTAARARGLHHLAALAEGVQMSLIAFTVAAMFHPIAYQFYLFCLAGLAVALRNAFGTELAETS